ncbi:MAG: NAD-dependent epimerase/dehydratase family protein [Acidimicrobiia bacterium]
MTRVLVTGGAGFVGSHVVDALVAAGDEVRVIDLLHPAAHRDEPDYLNPAAEYRWGDIADPHVAGDAVDGVDAVCHQAAMVGLGVDFGDAPAYASHNDLGTAVLLERLHRRRFRGRVVLASSMVVYGEGRYRCAEHGIVRPGPREPARLAAGQWDPVCPCCHRTLTAEAVPEDAAVDPRSVYAATKLHQEHLCAAFGREHEVPVTSLRYHNVYGARMPCDTPYAGVASIFRSALEAARPPRVFEDGGQRRDFVHVRDVALANVRALHAPEPVVGALNVASGNAHSILEMAEALAGAFGVGAPSPEVVGGSRPSDARHMFASTEAARERLGFSAVMGFEEGMSGFARAPLRAPPAG